MKSITLHRSGLTKERMNMFEEVKPSNLNKIEGIPQYAGAHEGDDLDLLYNKSTVRRFGKSSINKTPSVYLTVGFVSGILFTLLVMGIISLSTSGQKQEVVVADDTSKPVQEVLKDTKAPLPSDKLSDGSDVQKYTIKQGDTLDKVAFRFYGKYDPAKIEQIQKLNNIKNPQALQIGQEILIPVFR